MQGSRLRPLRRAGMPAAALLWLALLLASSVAASPTADAEASYREAERLAESGLYHLARRRYLEAASLGLDTPELTFRLGVVQHRTRHLDGARKALLRLTDDPEFGARACYHLGLIAHEQRSSDQALEWLLLATEKAADPAFAATARGAREELLALYRSDTETEEPAYRRLGPDDDTERYWSVALSLGYGYDDNIFRTPVEPYEDLTEPGAPLTDPFIQAWSYTPVDFSAGVSINTFEGERFFTTYDFAGRYYRDDQLDNADRKRHRLQVGSHYRQATEHGEREIRGVFELGHYRRNDLDPVDGFGREFEGENIEDRYRAWHVGPTLTLAEQRGRLRYGAAFTGEIRDHENYPAVPDFDRLDWDYEGDDLVPQYDHEFYSGSLHVSYLLWSATTLRAEASYYARRYAGRPAQNLDGAVVADAPPLEHRFVSLGGSATQELFDAVRLSLGYARTDRTDRHLGYDDYVRDLFWAGTRVRLGSRLSVDARAEYRDYFYPSAWAFDRPAGGPLQTEMLLATIAAEYRLLDRFVLYADAELQDLTSTDPRLTWDRRLVSVGLRWTPFDGGR